MLDSPRSKEEAWLGSTMATATYSTAALPALMGFWRPGIGIFGLQANGMFDPTIVRPTKTIMTKATPDLSCKMGWPVLGLKDA